MIVHCFMGYVIMEAMGTAQYGGPLHRATAVMSISAHFARVSNLYDGSLVVGKLSKGSLARAWTDDKTATADFARAPPKN
jgi:hypothetical protein